jgi:phthalate 4,5-dioxygenase reductase subunit
MQPPGADAHPMSSDHSSDARLDATDETAMTSLVVARAELAAEDIKLFELRHPEGADLPEFTSGAHISVRTPDGKIRKYSLANDPAERSFYQIAVKREAGGRGGSRSMFDALETGDTIPASVPRNDFPLAPSTAGYTLIAGGIGITPILSMARHLKSTGGRFKLYYLTRSREATAFHADLSQPQFRGIVTIHHDGGNPDHALDLWPVLEKPRGHVYCCGPRGLMMAVRDMTGHWSSAAVHFEAFQEPEQNALDNKPFKVTIASTGATIEVPAEMNILDALRAAGHKVPSSCESGTCGSCKTRLVSGDVDHRDLVLTEQEKPGHIMVCVSRALTGDLVIDI